MNDIAKKEISKKSSKYIKGVENNYTGIKGECIVIKKQVNSNLSYQSA